MAKNAVICCSEFSGLSGAFCGGGRGSAVALFFSCRRPAMSKHVTLVSRRGLQTSLACRKTSYIGFLLRFTCNSYNRVFIRRFYRDLHVVQNNLNNLKKSGYVITDMPYVKEEIFRLLKGKNDITSSPSDFDCL